MGTDIARSPFYQILGGAATPPGTSIAEEARKRKEEAHTVTDKKNEIVAAIGKELPNMTETERSYLIGFLEGFAAKVAERPGA